jgi:purine-binding chemotaxis protein CheW
VIVGQRGEEILVFEVDGRRFGLPAAEVRELLRAVAIVPLPMAPPAVEGVVNLRGRVVPVLDLRARLGLPARAVATTDHMIVAQSSGGLVALRVDRALDLVRHELEASAAAWTTEGARTRVARLADGLAPLLDLHTLLDGVAVPETVGVVGGAEAGAGDGIGEGAS